MTKIKKFFLGLGVFFFIILIIFLGINIYVLSFSNSDYYKEVNDLKPTFVGLVFGAAVYQNKIPSGILKDRLQVAYEAYKKGKIKKIIVSGDNGKTSYNEPEVMKNYLVELGVNKDDIYMDHAGFDTYDSIYRAKEIFGVKEITLFTQDFHLKRAMYISKRLGLKTYGMQTNLQSYLRQRYYNIREVAARIKAFFNVEIFHSKPKYLGNTIEILTDEKINEIKESILNNN